MITSHEIGKIFAIMNASYGHLWKQTETDIQVWFKKLNKYSEQAILKAAASALKTHPDHPPTLPQFDALCYAYSEPDYKALPAPVERLEVRQANRAMVKVIISRGGVHADTLRLMIELKNALVEDFDTIEGKFAVEVARQLTDLADSHEKIDATA